MVATGRMVRGGLRVRRVLNDNEEVVLVCSRVKEKKSTRERQKDQVTLDDDAEPNDNNEEIRTVTITTARRVEVTNCSGGTVVKTETRQKNRTATKAICTETRTCGHKKPTKRNTEN